MTEKDLKIELTFNAKFKEIVISKTTLTVFSLLNLLRLCCMVNQSRGH